MKLFLQRKEFREDGIFGEISCFNENGRFDKICVSLEHSYDNVPKIPCGEFKCVRGLHRLHNMDDDFETFEITGIEGHSNILFHWGNFNADSEGCVLVGRDIVEYNGHGMKMITHSRETFAQFIELQSGTDEFILVVS